VQQTEELPTRQTSSATISSSSNQPFYGDTVLIQKPFRNHEIAPPPNNNREAADGAVLYSELQSKDIDAQTGEPEADKSEYWTQLCIL